MPRSGSKHGGEALSPTLAVLALVRQLSVARRVGMFTNNPWLLKQHIAEVFPAVPEALFGTRAVFSAELGLEQAGPGGLLPPGHSSGVCARRDPLHLRP